ncbi:hypothetical protein GCM10010358_68290 [Streptomyces minutiscleroticus]|uniref:Uncharacterized protein n=1 Tax=Streptomyces minutiscleroticus TaxID=68238 RepID=A0A918U7Z5_9ACTN|nr:hypothetical protein [Streptomyces minutiscleroticus]GGY05235.1 hypothetical protein GCM10010358_68290 [Streptomyces minutiscleroticus]
MSEPHLPVPDGGTLTWLPLKPIGHQFTRDEVAVLDLHGEAHVMDAPYSCDVCDMAPRWQITEHAVHVQDPCPYPDGITTTITLNVPSGRILVTDDLRPVYRWERKGRADYSTALGQAQVVRAMAAIGCAFGPVGNTCPGLYRTGEDSFVIARPRYSEDENGDPDLPEDTCLANICTALWAYSIADVEHWKARGGDPGSLGWTDTIVDITPGTYQFTHHSGERGFDSDTADAVIFAHIQRIGEAQS